MTRTRIHTGAPWEARYGYCRAVRAGNQVFVTGTVALNADGSPHAPGDHGAQAARALEIIERALKEAGAQISDVVRTRMFVVGMTPEAQDAIGAAHRAVFADCPPATSMIGVAAFVDPAFVVEIEADAVVE
ncbi:RidA family protein [Glycocaulis abyssi]|uniref:RidA family protein n=1 Tax=Glycocaulis abyssi TaxID=1433403 RepID=A0ABV9NAV2_9PROT